MRNSVISVLTFIFSLHLLVGCVSTPSKKSQTFYWPPAPDLPRIKLEAQLRSEEDLQQITAARQFVEFATGDKISESPFIKPYDIAAYGGLLAVTDTRARVVHVVDVPRKRIFPIGWRREGKLSLPTGIAIDHNRQIYVADAGRGEIIVYDQLGLFLRKIGESKQFSHLSDVAVSPLNGHVYALDRGGIDSNWHRISHFDQEGKFIGFIGERGQGEGQFNHPTSLDITEDGKLVVLDAGNFRVQVFGPDGKFIRLWGKAGRGLGNLARPRGIAVNDQGLVVIGDTAFQNFQIFDLEGHLYLSVGEHGVPGGPGRYVLPSGVAADETGRLYVVDQALRKIDVWRILDEEQAKAVVR